MRWIVVLLLLSGWSTACGRVGDFVPTASEPIPSPSTTSSPVPTHTASPEPTFEPIFDTYLVEPGDSLFLVADKFRLQPETILFCNFDVLADNPHSFTTGMTLRIPPEDGILHRWQQGDTLQDVAREYQGSMVEMFRWPGHRRYQTEKGFQPEPGDWVFVPGGKRQFEGIFEPRIEQAD